MDVEQIVSEIEAGTLRNVYVLVGTEHYRIDRALAAIKAKALDAATAAWNTDLFHGKEASAVRIAAAARTGPMIGRRRLVLVRDADELDAEAQDALAALVVDPCPTTTLVILAEKLDGRRKLLGAAKKAGAVFEAPAVPERQLPAWATRLARSLGHQIDAAAATALVEHCGADLHLLDDAITRLSLFLGPGRPITTAAIDACIAPLRSGSVFELIEAVGRRRKQAALSLLGQLLDAREPALRILWWIARHVRQLVVAREAARAELPSRLGVPPFIADKIADQARSFDAAALERAVEVLAQADLDLKSAKRSERMILEQAVLRLCR
ncbi:MAG: DNA polymerase III subunit delta [Deltaproteobacteria bacterium]|nr:DNA polymerase III subunit delta [Deltaproteobacteria bacterium]